MGSTEKLYEELYELRDRLRFRNRSESGREPRICSDETLKEIAKRIPVNPKDFLAIVGIGVTFVDKYSEEFIKITRRYTIASAKGMMMDSSALDKLKDLEKKLINIGKGNKLLYTSKVSKSSSYDLYDAKDRAPLDALFSDRPRILCDISKGPDESARWTQINNIIREANRDFREKGRNDLYVGYPFVKGMMPGGKLPIRAPLTLFPVTLKRNAKTVEMCLDRSRDVLFNNTLVLANMKIDGEADELPDDEYDNPTKSGLMEDIQKFYHKCGINISMDEEKFHAFEEYTDKTFPKFKRGEFHLENCAVLGKFPMFSNAIQMDFNTLMSKSSLNKALDDLITAPDDIDRYEDVEPITVDEILRRGMAVSEKDLTYINALNSAQEQVICALRQLDALVVQGPPGTGKSQVITGLITTAIHSGKTVLMVSEKKTALDVVYSRLGGLSKYAMMIDDVGNKDRFYEQLEWMMNSPAPNERPPDLDHLSAEIDKNIMDLNRIANVMFAPCEFGIEPYQMYSLVKKVDLTDPAEYERYSMLKDNISQSLTTIRHDDLQRLHGLFTDDTMLGDLSAYYQCLDKVPWIGAMRSDLTEYELADLRVGLENLKSDISEWKSKNFISRMFGKGKISRDATTILSTGFGTVSEKLLGATVDNPMTIINGLEMYNEYTRMLASFNKLKPLEKLYGENLIAIHTKMPGTYAMSNDELYSFIVKMHLLKFEASNRDTLQDIRNFDSIFARVDDLIARKREATRANVEYALQENMRFVTESKNRGEIIRLLESQRKWSVNKFISKYGFDLFKGIKIWMLTPETVSEVLPLQMGVFDLVIFDEASQMYVEKGIPAIYRAKKVIIAGDHKQLRPMALGISRFSEEEESEDALLDEDSLLDVARSRYQSILLNFHYRSKYEELIAFSNYAFYRGRLYVSPNTEIPKEPPIQVQFIDDAVWNNNVNEKEAKAVADLLVRILNERKNNETIGIITFNKSQADLIYDIVDRRCLEDEDLRNKIMKEYKRFENEEDVGLFVKNIEKVQGDERDIIIFSTCYAKDYSGRFAQRFGWLNNVGGENRLNVAISRAKKRIHIVTSFQPSWLTDASKNDGPKYLKSYMEYAMAVSRCDKEMERTVLTSFGKSEYENCPEGDCSFGNQIYDALRNKGYNVEKHVGIGGYQIDVAVKNGDRYALGIECDNKIYKNSSSARERDYHRQKYLESRGWNIMRVWSSDWWNNPKTELEKIIDHIPPSA